MSSRHLPSIFHTASKDSINKQSANNNKNEISSPNKNEQQQPLQRHSTISRIKRFGSILARTNSSIRSKKPHTKDVFTIKDEKQISSTPTINTARTDSTSQSQASLCSLSPSHSAFSIEESPVTPTHTMSTKTFLSDNKQEEGQVPTMMPVAFIDQAPIIRPDQSNNDHNPGSEVEADESEELDTEEDEEDANSTTYPQALSTRLTTDGKPDLSTFDLSKPDGCTGLVSLVRYELLEAFKQVDQEIGLELENSRNRLNESLRMPPLFSFGKQQ